MHVVKLHLIFVHRNRFRWCMKFGARMSYGCNDAWCTKCDLECFENFRSYFHLWLPTSFDRAVKCREVGAKFFPTWCFTLAFGKRSLNMWSPVIFRMDHLLRNRDCSAQSSTSMTSRLDQQSSQLFACGVRQAVTKLTLRANPSSWAKRRSTD